MPPGITTRLVLALLISSSTCCVRCPLKEFKGRRKDSPARLIIRTHQPVFALNFPVFAGVGISCDSSSALVCITSRVIGKPSFRFSLAYWIARCSVWTIFGMSSRFSVSVSPTNVGLCYGKLPSRHTIVRNLCMVNYHHLEICVVPSPRARWNLGTRWSAFFNKIIASADNYRQLTEVTTLKHVFSFSQHAIRTLPWTSEQRDKWPHFSRVLLLRKHKANLTLNRAPRAQKQTLLRVLYNVKTLTQEGYFS
jgi:hypothetical protein